MSPKTNLISLIVCSLIVIGILIFDAGTNRWLPFWLTVAIVVPLYTLLYWDAIRRLRREQ